MQTPTPREASCLWPMNAEGWIAMVSEAVRVCINTWTNGTRLVKMGRQRPWSSSGFAFVWLTAGNMAKESVRDPTGDTEANLKAWSLAKTSSKLLRVTPATQLLCGCQPAPEQEGGREGDRAKTWHDPLTLSPRSCPALCLQFTKNKVIFSENLVFTCRLSPWT